jgi:hypothetical protein
MAAPTLGGTLRACRGYVTTQQLADCMFNQEHFAPSGVKDATDLEQHLIRIEADDPWPFGAEDVPPFVDAVINCLPNVPPALAKFFKITGARLYLQLHGLDPGAGP